MEEIVIGEKILSRIRAISLTWFGELWFV